MRWMAWFASLLLLVPPAVASADSVVLKSGRTFSGEIASAELILSGGEWPQLIALIDGSGEVMEFLRTEIECLVLEELDGSRIVRPGTSWRSERSRGVSTGTVLIGTGFVAGFVAMIVPFGGEEIVPVLGGRSIVAKDYNALNYVLLVGGGAAVVVGSIMNEREREEAVSSAPRIEPAVSPISGDPGLMCCLRF